MSKFLSFFILASSALIFLASVAIYLSNQSQNLQQGKTTSRPKGVEVYADKVGTPKYAQGRCEVDEECLPAGCSAHICSNNPSLITTCEIREDFPDKNIFSCGCIETRCVWYK